jgi:hypothetical protein
MSEAIISFLRCAASVVNKLIDLKVQGNLQAENRGRKKTSPSLQYGFRRIVGEAESELFRTIWTPRGNVTKNRRNRGKSPKSGRETTLGERPINPDW